MKSKYVLFITVLLTVVIIATGFCQDNTQVGLPEGAIARLGKGGINIMRFSPDGTRLAVGTDVGVWLYDVEDETGTALFTERVGQVNALAFSQDGKMLASGGLNSPGIQLWDVNTDSKHTIFVSAGSPAAIAFSQDSTTLTCLDFSIIRWNVDTGMKASDFPLWDGDTSSKVITSDSYEAAVLSQDGSSLATGTREGRIRLWDTTTGKRWMDLKGHAVVRLSNKVDMSILALAFSPDGKIIASGCIDNTVQLWDTEKGIKLATLLGHKGWVTALAFSADENTLASGDANKTIKLWDVDTHKERATLLGHKNTISTLTFAPEGTSPYSGCLASGSNDGTIRFWNPKNGEKLVTFKSGHTESVKAVAFSEDGTKLTTVAFNGIADVWDLKTKHELVAFIDGHCDSTAGAALSSDASFFARKGSKGFIAFRTHSGGHKATFRGSTPLQLWKVTTGKEISGPWQHTGNTNSLTFSPDNNMFVASIRGESIIGWHRNTGVELFRFNTGALHPRKLTFSPNGKLLTTNGTHVKTHVWDITTQRELTPPNMEKHSALAFSPDNTTLALGDTKGIVLWSVTPTGIQERDRITDKHRGFSSVLIFSPDGKILLDTRWAGIELWDTNGNDMGTLSGHTETITTLVFSHDGKTLASGSDDGTVLLWDWEKISAKSKIEQK
ncbi:MAG: WD40 repeat domain-containing protein [Candidatus Poribacteria bacterium]|nr:WD40 repeat domain-containing protein [Candidatus Poribacteria bacterium]